MSVEAVVREPARATMGRWQPCVAVRPVLLLGAVTWLVLVAGLTWPLRIWQPPDAITDWEPLARMIGRSPAGLLRFVLTLVLWCGCYLGALLLSRRQLSPGARRALLLFPALFAVTLAPTWPAASKDIYHYIIEGRTLAVHGLNPLTTPPAMLPPDPLYWILSSWQWEPSRYGPLWALVAAAPVFVAGDSLTASVLLFKAIAVCAFLATGFLVYRTAGRLRPALALPAYVLVAWNPLLLLESGANGHNDVLMLAFTTLALWCATRRDWTLAFPALAAAVLIKYTTGLLGPVLLAWAWREGRTDAGARRRIVAGLALGVWQALACYALFWEGSATVRALGGAAADALNSPGWLLREGLERSGFSENVARLAVGLPLTAVFLAAYAAALRMSWRGREGRTSLWSAGLLTLGVYLWTLSWWFWPWYVTWLLPLAALLAGRKGAWLAVVWSFAALAAYVPINYRPLFWGDIPDDRMPLAVSLTVFVPAALAAAVLFRPWRRYDGV